MKRVTFKAALTDPEYGKVQVDVDGYAVEVEGIPLVVHRQIIDVVKDGPGFEALFDEKWHVSEPKSGLRIPINVSENGTHQGAVNAAIKTIRDKGVGKVKELIK